MVKYKHTPDDADNLAAELIPTNIAIDFGDANWKVRLAALEEMTSWVEQDVEELDAEVLVRFIAKKGWAEKNFQARDMVISIDCGDANADCRCHPRYTESSLLWLKKAPHLDDLVALFVYLI